MVHHTPPSEPASSSLALSGTGGSCSLLSTPFSDTSLPAHGGKCAQERGSRQPVVEDAVTAPRVSEAVVFVLRFHRRAPSAGRAGAPPTSRPKPPAKSGHL